MDVSVLNSLSDLSEIKQDWENIISENLEENLYYSFDWFYAVSAFFIQQVSSPFIICVREQEKTVAILPCCIKQRHLRLFSYNSLELIGNIYSAYRGGIVLKNKEETVACEVIAFLIKHRKSWDLINFEDLSENDPFLSAMVIEMRRQKLVSHIVSQYSVMVIDCHSGVCSLSYWQSLSKSFKQQIRSAINKLNREGVITIVPIRLSEQDIATAMDHYYWIYENSWKEPEMDPQFHRKLAEYLQLKGKLRLFTLYFNKDKSCVDQSQCLPVTSYESDISSNLCIPDGYLPIATTFYAVNGSYACFLKTAYHQDYAAYSAGTVLNWFAVKWLMDKDHVSIIDLQKEDDAYKFKWGRFKEMHVMLQATHFGNPLAVMEICCEKKLVPLVRKIKARNHDQR